MALLGVLDSSPCKTPPRPAPSWLLTLNVRVNYRQTFLRSVHLFNRMSDDHPWSDPEHDFQHGADYITNTSKATERAQAACEAAENGRWYLALRHMNTAQYYLTTAYSDLVEAFEVNTEHD